ncbi:hypothetical protein SEVIR_7G170250v4 [Setaria viridis]
MSMSLLLCPAHATAGDRMTSMVRRWVPAGPIATRHPPDRSIGRRAPGSSDVARKITWLLFRASDRARTAWQGGWWRRGLFYARIAVVERGCGDFGRLTPATGVARSGGGPPRPCLIPSPTPARIKPRPRTTGTRPARSPPAYIYYIYNHSISPLL